MKRFDAFSVGNPQLSDELYPPEICFDGGEVYEGRVHQIFRLRETGLTYEAWESGGYTERCNEEERTSSVEELKSCVLAGKKLLPKWSNPSGFDFLNKVMNGVTEEEIKKRIAQVRDVLNKCRNIERIEAVARVLGV